MKTKWLTLLLLLVSFCYTEASAPDLDDKDLLHWRGHGKLSWDDFMDLAPEHCTSAARTSTKITINFQVKQGELEHTIGCYFIRSRSWTISADDYLLEHEQAHFDIAELYARKLNKAIQEYHFNKTTYRSDLSYIYNNILKDYECYQEMYDSDTRHSADRPQQEKWLGKVKKDMEALEKYAGYSSLTH